MVRPAMASRADTLNPMTFKRLNDEITKKTSKLMERRNDVLQRMCATRARSGSLR